jgi:hypothetical protein
MADEKPSYAQINRKVWNTCQFRSLSREARELFFYLTTCPHGNMLGIFVLRPGYALDDLQWGSERERFMKPLSELLTKQLFAWDDKTDIILDLEQIVKHTFYNPNQVKAAIKILNTIPKTTLFHQLKTLIEPLNEPLLKPFIKRLDERLSDLTETVTVPESVTETAGVSETISPVDNSPKEKTGLLEPFVNHIARIKEKFNSPKIEAQVVLFLSSHANGANRDAIIYCLDEFLKYGEGTQAHKVKIYLEKILLRVNGNYNEAEHTAKAQEFKKPLPSGFTKLGDIAAMPKGGT